MGIVESNLDQLNPIGPVQKLPLSPHYQRWLVLALQEQWRWRRHPIFLGPGRITKTTGMLMYTVLVSEYMPNDFNQRIICRN